MQKEERRLRAKMLTGQKPAAIHLSLPSFPSTSELLVLSHRGEVFPRNIARTAGVSVWSHAFMLGLNGEGSEVLMDTFEVDNKGW